MGIDKSLTDDFPSVTIEGRKYHYGRENVYGQYLVENAEYAKDYWCFNTREDLEAFLIMLPESADRDWAIREHPDWHDVSAEQRSFWIDEHRRNVRDQAGKRKKEQPGLFYNALQFDAADWYLASSETHDFEDIVVQCECRELAHNRRGWVVTLCEVNTHGPNRHAAILKFSREHAIKVATALLSAAADARRHQENE